MLHPVTRQEIAKHLGIDRKTLRRKIKASEIDLPKGLIAPEKQKEIYEKLGYKELWKQIAI